MTTICAFDIETTGLLKPDQRIIEFYGALWDLEARMRLDELHLRIDPERSISAEAEAVHHISLAMLAGCPTFEKTAAEIVSFMERADLLVAHNGAGFDAPFLSMELARIGRETIDLPMLDTFLEGRWATPDGRVPSLKALCHACDVDYDLSRAHAASYDVEVMTRCLFLGLDWGFFKVDSIVKGQRLAA